MDAHVSHGHDNPTRRNLLEIAAAAGIVLAGAGRAFGQDRRGTVTEADLLRFDALGQVTILHMTDVHAQLLPIYFREPSTNLGVGEAKGLAPHLTDRAFLDAFQIEPASLRAYMLASRDHETLARAWGRVGGMDRMARLVSAIRAERGAGRVLLLDGGDGLQGSYTALQSRGGDMARVLDQLGVEATTGHWEFTYGADRMAELFGTRERAGTTRAAFLAGNVFDNEFDEPVFHAMRLFEKGGVRIAVIGQAFPYTPIANPRWMIAKWSMGIREDEIRKSVASARAQGAEVVVLLSHNGFDVDRKLAGRVPGIDVILTAHTHDALPVPVVVGSTLLIASGSHGKFLSRLDLDIRDRRVAGYRYSLIPVLADAIAPDPAMARLVAEIRAPHAAMLQSQLAVAASQLYRRDNFSGPLDEVIIDAMLAERGAEIAFSPGFRWGPTIMPGPITWDDVYNATAMTYPACYRTRITGAQIKDILEDVADNLLNPDPYYQQGGDMVRVGGLRYALHIENPMGSRIASLTLAASGRPLDPDREYVVAGWGSVNEGTEGPAIWDVAAAYLSRKRTIEMLPPPSQTGDVYRLDRNGKRL